MLKLLLEKGANDVNVGDKIGQTPVLRAVIFGDLKVLQLLLPKMPNLDTKDCFGLSALKCAITKNHPEIVRSLLESNARLDLVTIDG